MAQRWPSGAFFLGVNHLDWRHHAPILVLKDVAVIDISPHLLARVETELHENPAGCHHLVEWAGRPCIFRRGGLRA